MMLLTPDRRAQLVRWFRMMVLIRHFEEAAAVAYTRARVGGYLHLNVGEEASVVGSRPNLVASFPPYVQLKIGDRVQIAVDAKNLHFFDEVSGAPLR